MRALSGLSLAIVGLVLVAVVGCGGESKECGGVCEGRCGFVSGCDCGPCDGCGQDGCEETVCLPACEGKECGEDGCGGWCGGCEGALVCTADGQCAEPCERSCEGRECGDDGCGGECGQCEGGEACSLEGQCETECVEQCDGKECGDDGCGGECGQCGAELPFCQKGICKASCEPECDGGRECGDDGCGGECGQCDEGFVCGDDGMCVCGGCAGRECGADGCGGSCGSCEANNEICVDGQCVCQPNCIERECGSDGCGGSCGECKLNHVCTADGSCVCMPSCEGKECGPDGCGSICGQCGCGEECLLFQCEFTACAEKECGLDGCGGSCGSCGAGKACVLGKCPGEGMSCDDGNEVEWDGCNGGELGEFLVNETTAGEQILPDVAVLDNGWYVVVWQDSAGDAASLGVKGRLFAPDGSAPAGEFLVNTYQFSAQGSPAVEALGDGGFVVVWQSDGQDGGLNGVFGQRFKGNGVKNGAEFQVNTFSQYNQKAPAVTGLEGGGFAVLWEGEGQDGMDYGIFGQRFGADGGKAGLEFQVNTETISKQQMPAVSGLAGGGFMSLWGSYSSGAIGWDLFGQMWGPDGEALGTEFAINAPWSMDGSTLNYQVHGRLAPLPQGFIAVWQSTGQDGYEDGVFAQRFGSMGKEGGEEMVHELATGSQQYPDVVAVGGGSYAVVWQSTERDASGSAVIMRRFSSGGVAQGGEVLMNVFGTGDQGRPRVGSFEDGALVVVWQSSPQDGSGSGVYARRVALDGSWLYR